ncbi:hypothetical protein ACFW04_010968 [Cataglyphis niger]
MRGGRRKRWRERWRTAGAWLPRYHRKSLEEIDTTARLIAKLVEKASKELHQRQAEQGRLLRSEANYFIPMCRLLSVREVNDRRYRIEWTFFESPFNRFVLGFISHRSIYTYTKLWQY